VRSLKTVLTLLLAIVWLPVTSHCLLFESTTSFELLACCTHVDPPSDTEHHEDECGTDSCSLIEDAQYKSSQQRITAPQPEAHVVFELPPLPDIMLALAPDSIYQSDDALTRLPASWQFSLRAALLARAPSFVS